MNNHIYNRFLIEKSEKLTFRKTDSFKVMKRAAKLCSNYIVKNYIKKNIIVICGPGNNGGDGALIANYLIKKDFKVNICYPIAGPKSRDSKKALSLLKDKSVIINKPNFYKYDLIIDSLFGVGKMRKNNKIINLFSDMNKSNVDIISIDMPSGIDTDNGQICRKAIKAKTTLTFHRFKIGQFILPGKEYSGKINIFDIGLKNLDKENNIFLNYPEKIPSPSLYDHKFSRGICLIIAADNLIGASKLALLSASQSALRAGAGMCYLAVKKSEVNSYKSHVLEEVIIKYNNLNELNKILKSKKINSIVYGCGIENNKMARDILDLILKKSINLILDASIFTIMEKRKKHYISILKKRNSSTVMTPHFGEFKRLFNTTNNKVLDCLKASKESNAVIIHKGNDTVIAAPSGEIYINSESSPYLATAGSGDILSGLIGGFLSQGVKSIKSAKLGCYIHSKCAKNLGPGLIASDIAKEIPNVIKSLK